MYLDIYIYVHNLYESIHNNTLSRYRIILFEKETHESIEKNIRASFPQRENISRQI